MERNDTEGAEGAEDTEGQRESGFQKINERTRAVIGAAVEVHRNLGAGFAEAIYERALCWELTNRLIPFRRQVPIQVRYKESVVGRGQIDLLVDGRLVVELKSVELLLPFTPLSYSPT